MPVTSRPFFCHRLLHQDICDVDVIELEWGTLACSVYTSFSPSLLPLSVRATMRVQTPQLGFDVLVKQRRAWDINGTPLLCLAASSRSITICSQTVYDKPHTVLGIGERKPVRFLPSVFVSNPLHYSS